MKHPTFTYSFHYAKEPSQFPPTGLWELTTPTRLGTSEISVEWEQYAERERRTVNSLVSVEETIIITTPVDLNA